MNMAKLLGVLFLGSALALGAFAATEAPKQPAGKKAGCCVKAAEGGGTCTHACCVEAAKAKKNCEKCGGTNPAAAPST